MPYSRHVQLAYSIAFMGNILANSLKNYGKLFKSEVERKLTKLGFSKIGKENTNKEGLQEWGYKSGRRYISRFVIRFKNDDITHIFNESN